MKTLDILIIILSILVIIYLLKDNEFFHSSIPIQQEEKLIEKINYKYITNKKEKVIEKLTNNPHTMFYYPLSFSSLPSSMKYIPDDCLPLNFAYDSVANSLLLNGSGTFISTGTDLSSITLSSTMNIILLLSLSSKPNITLPINHGSFSTGTCNQNSNIPKIINSITITNNSQNPTYLINSYTNINGSIKIGSVSFKFDSFNFGTSLSLEDIYINSLESSVIEDDTPSVFVLPQICNVQACIPPIIPETTINKIGSEIPVSQSIIDKLIKSNTPFALYTNVVNSGIPESQFSDQKVHKLYLSAGVSNGKYVPCNLSNGMFSLSDKLTKGSIFNVSSENRYIPVRDIPYKYLDFDSVYTDTLSGKKSFVSTFYNLSLYTNKYSMSYCLEGCDNSNIHGICAQEQSEFNIDHQSKFTNKQKDMYSLKNYLKFKIENDDRVTPYFISLFDNNEQIHFITNKYSTSINPNDYKTLVQVPIYGDDSPYYEIPELTVKNGMNYYFNKKEPITGLTQYFSLKDTTEYFQRTSLSPEETHAFKNDAYNSYAIKFFIQIIDPTVIDIDKLPFN
jgi:hypothetical protein